MQSINVNLWNYLPHTKAGAMHPERALDFLKANHKVGPQAGKKILRDLIESGSVRTNNAGYLWAVTSSKPQE